MDRPTYTPEQLAAALADGGRFWSKVNKSGPVPAHRPQLGPCWLWGASKSSSGYGQIKVAGSLRQAHIAAYVVAVGLVPDGLQLDHLCRVRHCVRPDHLEPVTSHENTARGTNPAAPALRDGKCQRGHSMHDAYTFKTGRRRCRSCQAERDAARSKSQSFREARLRYRAAFKASPERVARKRAADAARRLRRKCAAEDPLPQTRG